MNIHIIEGGSPHYGRPHR